MRKPSKEINEEEVEKLAALGCTTDEIGAWFGVSRDTIERRAFPSLLRGRELMKISLRRKQFEQAMKGNSVMLVWLGKQYLDQRDTFQARVEIERAEVSKLDDQRLAQEAARVLQLVKKDEPANSEG